MKKPISENKEYYNMLFEFSKFWASKKFIPFTIDDLRVDLIAKYGKIETPFIYGAIIKDLMIQGLILDNDKMVKSQAKGNKGRMIKQWISKEYSELQSKKRLLEETAKARELAKQQTNLV